MSMVLQSKTTGDFKPHPEGIHPAVCVDVMDLGLMEVEFQGQRKVVNKVRLVFESEQKLEDGRNCIITKNFTASLHPKAKLAEFLGKWRGRPVLPGETIDLGRLIGANCTLVISHQQSLTGQTYAAIDAISKPTKKLAASGYYDPAAARQRFEEWKAKQQAGPAPKAASPQAGGASRPLNPVAAAFPQQPAGASRTGQDGNTAAPQPQATPFRQPQPAPVSASQEGPNMAYDPEIGF